MSEVIEAPLLNRTPCTYGELCEVHVIDRRLTVQIHGDVDRGRPNRFVYEGTTLAQPPIPAQRACPRVEPMVDLAPNERPERLGSSLV
jgi:hypothetical protein